jgi:hypothetical protein
MSADQEEITEIARNRRDRKGKSKAFTTEGAEEHRGKTKFLADIRQS